MKSETIDPRDTAIAAATKRSFALPAAAIEDLKYFHARAVEGRAITFPALREYVEKNHGVSIGRGRMASTVKEFGGTAWWTQ